MSAITPLGTTNWRETNQVFGIKDADRLGHIYVIGKTGTGKSTLLEQMAISDIKNGNGLCVIDPHGDIAEDLLHYIPQDKIKDVIYFNATDTAHPIGFNPLSSIEPKDFNLVTSNLIITFKKIWAESWGPRLEHIMRFSMLSLLHYPSATLLDMQRLLTDPFFRRKVLNHVSDHSIIEFWEREFDKYSPQLRSEAIAPILNKTGILLASLPLRNIIGQPQSSFEMHEILRSQKILICNLSKGQIGEDAAAILGSIIVTAIQGAAFARASVEPSKRTPFYLYIDEVHSFVTLSFADILAEARKYGLSVFLAHQYIEQLHEKIRAAIFGNVGTMIVFRVGATDAAYLAKEFHPVFSEDDLVNLPRYSMYLKLMINGATSKPFSATTLPLSEVPSSFKDKVIAYSQQCYGTSIEQLTKDMEKELYTGQVSNKRQQTLFDEI